MTTTLDARLRRHPDARQILLDAIRDKQGQWTTGRVKALYRKTIPTHVWRATVRRHLRELHAIGHLELRSNDSGRRYYVYRQLTCRKCGDTDGPFKGTTDDALCEGCINTGGAW